MEATMTGQEHTPHENPLDEYAAKASQELAGRVTDVTNSNVARVESGQVSLRESFARSVESAATYMEDAAAGVVKTGSLEASNVSIGVVQADTLRADTVEAGLLAANQVEGREIRAGRLGAAQVQGTVQTWLSLRTGFAIGAGGVLRGAVAAALPEGWTAGFTTGGGVLTISTASGTGAGKVFSTDLSAALSTAFSGDLSMDLSVLFSAALPLLLITGAGRLGSNLLSLAGI